jgi:hypothetical protein
LKKILSFSLYGNTDEYLDKFILNTPLYKKYFFDYSIYLFVEEILYDKVIKHCNFYSIIVEKKHKCGQSDGMLWRYEPILKGIGDLCLVRDVDYKPTHEELELIDNFINSSYEFQIMRMHYDHRMPIMGGLFAIKSNLYKVFNNAYLKWSKNLNFANLKYNDDQLFLAKYIYHKVVSKSLIITTNVIFFGERVIIKSNYRDLLIGGDERHQISFKKKIYLYIYLPVFILTKIDFKGMNFIFYKRKYV